MRRSSQEAAAGGRKGCKSSAPASGSTGHQPQQYEPSVEVPASRVLYAVLVLFNPAGFARRTELFLQTLRELQATARASKGSPDHLKVLTVELQFGDTDFVSAPVDTDKRGPSFRTASALGLRSPPDAILWPKENLINLARTLIPNLGSDQTFIAWVDADITFLSKSWVTDTMNALTRAPGFCQLFDTAVFLKRSGARGRSVHGFGAQHAAGKSLTAHHLLSNKDKEYWHPGFAWAADVRSFDAVGGLPEFTMGGADRHVAYALLGRVGESLPSFPLHPSYLAHLVEFEGKVKASVLRLSCIQGTVLHHWHGKLRHRKYVERMHAVSSLNFATAMVRRPDGLLLLDLTRVPVTVSAAVRRFYLERQEDGNSDSYDVGGPAGPPGQGSSRQGAGGRSAGARVHVPKPGHQAKPHLHSDTEGPDDEGGAVITGSDSSDSDGDQDHNHRGMVVLSVDGGSVGVGGSDGHGASHGHVHHDSHGHGHGHGHSDHSHGHSYHSHGHGHSDNSHGHGLDSGHSHSLSGYA